MNIRSENILAAMTEKAHSHAHDGSRHLLCPACRIRTRLYALADGRKKCSACGKKFSPGKKTDAARLRRFADLLVCFCLNLTARQASDMTGYHYRLVNRVYDRFRMLLASQNLTPGKIGLLRVTERCDRGVHDSAFCRRCRGRFGCKGRKSGDSPVFGVKMLAGGVFVDPLDDDEAAFRFDRPSGDVKGKFSAYAGFICRGKFHRFEGNDGPKNDGAERLWAWMSERLKPHHGIWKRNTGLYLKELEWKYNHRGLSSGSQALAIAGLMPDDFLAAWAGEENIGLEVARLP